MSKRKNDEKRRANMHALQMRRLELSADPRISLTDRIELLKRLDPKYFIRAIDETLALELDFDKRALEEVRSKVKNKELFVAKAMGILTCIIY